MVVLCLFTMAHFSYASSMENVEVMKHLNRLNKRPVKSIMSPDGDIIDCVRISHQLAFDHPLLKNHTIKTRPSYYPNWAKDDNARMNTSKETFIQLWHSKGKCPEGTIPVRRTKKKDVLRFNSVKSYRKKMSSFPASSSTDPAFVDVRSGHEHVIASTLGTFYGSKATFNVWNPHVQEQMEFSLGQLWILAGPDSVINTIEAGWHVDPYLYGDTNTRLFIFWTNDGYQVNACYNLLCSGFVQTSNEIAIGGSLSTSKLDGSQSDITIFIWKEKKEGDWWMKVDGKVIGYWPATLFSYLRESASRLDWGGEVINLNTNGQHTTTQMGNGYFPQKGLEKASYIKQIQTVDESITLRTPQDLKVFADRMSCYDIVKGVNNDDNWGSHFFYGGPGRNPNCP
ncbi:hypothetical protein QVD17_35148 [Tagetes erecta]|uniref:Neprosin PEP catalytic domain-containing protein n=1 Tax=Tagetes erecta TaxID=13708 RepID=A0AAD8K1K6_TARER|nr:hypothetical protein QVD17_35148 [Tagetes erecta]